MQEVKEFRKHTSNLLVAADGQIFVPKSGKHKEHYTYGCTNNHGYKQVRFKGKDYLVHRLVAETYIDNPENKPYIDHINMVKTDNRLENLRWCTHQENHSFTDQDVHKRIARKCSKQVIQYTLDDVEIAKFPSASEVERQLGFFQNNISVCCNGKQKTAYGYKWEYVED